MQASHRANAEQAQHGDKGEDSSRTAEQRHENISGGKKNSSAQGGRRGKRRVVRTNPRDKATSHNAGAPTAIPVQGEKDSQKASAPQTETKVIRRGKKRAVKKTGVPAAAARQERAGEKASTNAPETPQTGAKDAGRRRRRVARRATS